MIDTPKNGENLYNIYTSQVYLDHAQTISKTWR